MSQETVNEKRKEIAATRVRKQIYWHRMRGEQVDDQTLESIVKLGLWRYWGGYERLLDCLLQELQVPEDQALDLTAKAIEWRVESGELYGIDE